MFSFLVFLFWVVVLLGARYAFVRWRQWRYLQPARYISEIRGVGYYRDLTPAQFESLMMQVFKRQQFTLLGDPYLGRSSQQGYVWKAGKKFALLHCPEKPITAEALDAIAVQQKKRQADQVLIFSPFPRAPRPNRPGLEIVAGRKLIAWFSVLEDIRPPLAVKIDAGTCQCGTPMEQRVNRAGRPLLVCSRYPDCRLMQRPAAKAANAG